jgi:hypothetical protein
MGGQHAIETLAGVGRRRHDMPDIGVARKVGRGLVRPHRRVTESLDMQALKILVVVMGVLLVLGAAALVVGIVYKVNHRPVAGGPSTIGQPTNVALPAGAHVETTEMFGDRLVVRAALADGGIELILFDLRNGARVATIDLAPAKP